MIPRRQSAAPYTAARRPLPARPRCTAIPPQGAKTRGPESTQASRRGTLRFPSGEFIRSSEVRSTELYTRRGPRGTGASHTVPHPPHENPPGSMPGRAKWLQINKVHPGRHMAPPLPFPSLPAPEQGARQYGGASDGGPVVSKNPQFRPRVLPQHRPSSPSSLTTPLARARSSPLRARRFSRRRGDGGPQPAPAGAGTTVRAATGAAARIPRERT
jgi:hypothetical protein